MPEIPFQYDLLEDAVVERLDASMTSIANVSALPESDKGIQDVVKAAIVADKAMILVAYSGSDFSPSSTTNYVQQDEMISILINIRFNKLRGLNGIYSQIRKIKSSLLGFKFSFGDRLQLKTVELDDRNEDIAIFSYNVMFTMKKPIIQIDTDGEDTGTESLLKTLKYEKDGEVRVETNAN